MNDDLISRSALLKDGIRVRCGLSDNGMIFVPMADVRKSIEEAPAVDAEEVFKHLHWVKEALEMAKQTVAPVVRCRDCAYWPKAKANKKGFLICPASGMEIMANDFCSYGEKRADDATD